MGVNLVTRVRNFAISTQIAALLRVCHSLGVPIVARGAGMRLAGGALPHAMGVTLSLDKFNKILAVNAYARTDPAQCVVRNAAISEAAAPHGPYCAPDPSSQIAAPSAATSPRTPAAFTA